VDVLRLAARVLKEELVFIYILRRAEIANQEITISQSLQQILNVNDIVAFDQEAKSSKLKLQLRLPGELRSQLSHATANAIINIKAPTISKRKSLSTSKIQIMIKAGSCVC
jgi:hypothetical protein